MAMRTNSHRESAPLATRTARAGAPPLKSSRVGDTRRQVLNHAARLLCQNGYAFTSLRDIANAAGMKAGSIYYHFDSKETLAETVMNEGIEFVRASVKEALAARPKNSDPLEDIGVAIKAHLRALRDSGDYASANIRCFAHVPDDMKRRLRRVRQRYDADWRKLIGRARLAKRLADHVDDEALRYGLLGAMNWTLEWLRSGGPTPDDLGEMFFQIMFQGASRSARN
jgi:AcrR family transcriptional regulator